jgi:hypothetical protein
VKKAAVSVLREQVIVSHARHGGAIKPVTSPTPKSKFLLRNKVLFKETMFIFREHLTHSVAPWRSRKTLFKNLQSIPDWI